MFLHIFVLLSILLTTSFEYKTDCEDDLSQPCTVYLTPWEDAFTKLLGSIDPTTKMLYNIENLANSVEPDSIQELNDKIKKHVGQTEIKTFAQKLPVLYRFGMNITIVEDLSKVTVPSDLTTTTETTKSYRIRTTTLKPTFKKKVVNIAKKKYNKLANFIQFDLYPKK
ncbi:Hypothetical protein SRAE_2000492200 [Strongyloides ratti]|uniref:Uncharacterized protein n=1 Tax=Strongyloides ratti TaxID=34506 RepID=A0A090LQ54_STRRB|nr:Hypothetical protein SRAE_2000492200 [Strongyloides ratti]CEF70289.1 Hypothetical protein SRAE_2000492200 [Strongyloides ratti]